MRGTKRSSLRGLMRHVFVPLLAWLLVAQSVMLPVARGFAAQAAGVDRQLSVLCSPNLPVQADGQPSPTSGKACDFNCCTTASRLDLDIPVAVLALAPAFETPLAQPRPVEHAPLQARAPPERASTPAAARAPPLPV